MSRDSDHPEESCGLFAVYGSEEASELIYQGLFSQQHRGQEGAGMTVSDGRHMKTTKGLGLVGDVFGRKSLEELKGSIGIGHVRYSTTGSTKIQNVQPLAVDCLDGTWAVAHNGNLVNASELRNMYQEAGAIFQTGTDSEVLIHLLADPMYRSRPGRVARALSTLKGAFAFLIMTRDCVIAARDPHGFRPLSIGRSGDAWFFASETCALAQVGVEYVRDVEPGEMVVVDRGGLHSHAFAEPSSQLAQCVFEMVYFARPDSRIFGHNVHQVRLQYGIRLAREHPVEADVVVPVPDSGTSAALGFSRGSGIELDYGFIRNHYVGRTFIMPVPKDRVKGVDLKLSVLPEVVDGKRVVVVDDSIVRGITVKERVARLRESGAKEVHVRVSSPPTARPCFFGIDFPTTTELIAGEKSVEEIRQFIEADTLGYLSVDGLLSPFGDPGDFCTACFTGRYAVDYSGAGGKNRLEGGHTELGLELE